MNEILTFTRDMAEAIFHVLGTHAPYGTYDCTGSGAVKSWADIARAVFEAANGNDGRSFRCRPQTLRPRRRPHRPASGPLRARPVQAESVGFLMPDWEEELGSTPRRSSRS
ncbi:MAG: sugar nucleotide-binding protein [Collinsella sp.]